MYYEFYIDIFFLENMLLDFLLLLLTGKLLKRQRSLRRLLPASFAGAAGACLWMATPLRQLRFLGPAGYGATALLMTGIAFGFSRKRVLLQGILYLWVTAFLLGGVFQALEAQLAFPVPVAAVISTGILVLLERGCQGARYQTQNYYEVTLGFQGRTVSVRALRDTGNQLREPVTGKAVSILSYEDAKTLFDKDTKMFYIPYHSIGKSSGLLPGVTLDYMSIRRDKDSQRLERPVVAVSREPVSREGKYQMILHPQLLND